MDTSKLGILELGIGKKAGLRPGDLVGAITGEAKIPSKVLGRIKVDYDTSYIEVPESLLDQVIVALRGTSIRGKKVAAKRFESD